MTEPNSTGEKFGHPLLAIVRGMVAFFLVCSYVSVMGNTTGSAAKSSSKGGAESRTTIGENSKQVESLREGSKLLDQIGYFQLRGDRATFYTEMGQQKLMLVGLENLNMDRIVRTIDAIKRNEERKRLRWQVNGVITEFRGRNFLLIKRAILLKKAPKSKPKPSPTTAN